MTVWFGRQGRIGCSMGQPEFEVLLEGKSARWLGPEADSSRSIFSSVAGSELYMP